MSNDIVQRLALGLLTQDEKKGYSADNKQYATDELEPLEPRKISFKLTKEQRIAVYQDVAQRVTKGASARDIGIAVLACIEEHLQEKENEAYGTESPVIGKNQKGKGGFRRV